MKSRTLVAVVGGVVLLAGVGVFLGKRHLDQRIAGLEEELRDKSSRLFLGCSAGLREHLSSLHSTISRFYLYGAPPGSSAIEATSSVHFRGGRISACADDDALTRQLDFVDFLVATNQFYSAAKRVYELKNTARSGWASLEVVKPPDVLADVWVVEAVRPKAFELSAWSRWHPREGYDVRARVFTLLDGAERAWHIALGNRKDITSAKNDPALVAAITKELASIGLTVKAPAGDEAVISWAWTAPYDEFERIAREAELLDPNDEENPLVLKLRDAPYDYARFAEVLRRARPESSR